MTNAIIFLFITLAALLNSCSTNVIDSEAATPEEAPIDTEFTCKLIDEQYTVMYSPAGQSLYSSAWLTLKPEASDFFGDPWMPQKRCQDISQRLELYRPDGFLELSTSETNGYDFVCMTTEKNPNCRIVYTLTPSEDPVLLIEQIQENQTVTYWFANMALFSVMIAFLIEMNNSPS